MPYYSSNAGYYSSEIQPKPRIGTRLYILKRDKCRCSYCGRSLTIDTLSIDHIVPICKLGSIRDKNNLAAACIKCNTKKKDKLLEQISIHFASNIRMAIEQVSKRNDDIIPDVDLIVDFCLDKNIAAGRLRILELLRRDGLKTGERLRSVCDTKDSLP